MKNRFLVVQNLKSDDKDSGVGPHVIFQHLCKGMEGNYA